jgi:hypothetical protein
MHGLEDEIINIDQAMALHRKLGRRSVMPLFITGAGHNNLECYSEFTARLRAFLAHVQPGAAADPPAPVRCSCAASTISCADCSMKTPCCDGDMEDTAGRGAGPSQPGSDRFVDHRLCIIIQRPASSLQHRFGAGQLFGGPQAPVQAAQPAARPPTHTRARSWRLAQQLHPSRPHL